MATLGSTVMTLLDWAKRADPGGQTADIVELLNQRNEILDDMLFKMGNLPTGNRTTMRTGLPTVAWRQLNQGVQPSKSTTVQVDDKCATLEGWSQIDAKLAEYSDDLQGFLLSEAMPFLEAIAQTHAQTLIYGDDTTTKEKFLGLTPRYNSLSAGSAQNIINCAGAGSDNTSLWLVVWGPNTIHGIFPKGSKAGIQHDHLGVETVENAGGVTGALMRAYRDRWAMDTGLSVRDWRFAVRACNIDVSNLVGESSAADLIKTMVKMMARIPNISAGRPVFYCNRTVREMLDIQALNKASAQLTIDTVDGKPITRFRAIPIKTVDAINNAEALVS